MNVCYSTTPLHPGPLTYCGVGILHWDWRNSGWYLYLCPTALQRHNAYRECGMWKTVKGKKADATYLQVCDVCRSSIITRSYISWYKWWKAGNLKRKGTWTMNKMGQMKWIGIDVGNVDVIRLRTCSGESMLLVNVALVVSGYRQKRTRRKSPNVNNLNKE